jgi:hypothetical protein
VKVVVRGIGTKFGESVYTVQLKGFPLIFTAHTHHETSILSEKKTHITKTGIIQEVPNAKDYYKLRF